MAETAVRVSGGLRIKTSQEAANKQLVLDYYRDIEATVGAGKGSELSKVDAKYRDPGCIQHGVNQGARGTPSRGGSAPRMGPPRLLSIMAEGEMVHQVTMRSILGPDGKAWPATK